MNNCCIVTVFLSVKRWGIPLRQMNFVAKFQIIVRFIVCDKLSN